MNNLNTVVLAAGNSLRFGEDKLLINIQNHSVLSLAIEPFINVSDYVIIILPENSQKYQDSLSSFSKHPKILTTKGGSTRHQSLINAIDFIRSNNLSSKYLLIHDGARPLVDLELINRVIDKLQKQISHAVVPVLSIKDTVYQKLNNKTQTIDRDKLFRAQTPQGFLYDTLVDSINSQTHYTDEISLLLESQNKVEFVHGDENNIKITSPSDLMTAKRLKKTTLHKHSSGHDIHRLELGSKDLIIGGLLIESDLYLVGHSDADVVMHALTDAIYGLSGSGDIGIHFPPSQNKWKNANSQIFLEHALQTLKDKQGQLTHIDITVIAEYPKLSPYNLQIRQNLAKICYLPLDSVSVKATTSEGLGFTGRGEGIYAIANVSASF